MEHHPAAKCGPFYGWECEAAKTMIFPPPNLTVLGESRIHAGSSRSPAIFAATVMLFNRRFI